MRSQYPRFLVAEPTLYLQDVLTCAAVLPLDHYHFTSNLESNQGLRLDLSNDCCRHPFLLRIELISPKES